MRTAVPDWRQQSDDQTNPLETETRVSKRARKKRDRKKSKANHGNRPNS
jgi:hypothetical protein